MSGAGLTLSPEPNEVGSTVAPNTPGPLSISQLEAPHHYKRRGTLEPLPSLEGRQKSKKKRTKRKDQTREDRVRQEKEADEKDLPRSNSVPIRRHEEEATVEDSSLLSMRSRLNPIINAQSDNIVDYPAGGDPPTLPSEPEVKKKRRKKKRIEGVVGKEEFVSESVPIHDSVKRDDPQAEGESSQEHQGDRDVCEPEVIVKTGRRRDSPRKPSHLQQTTDPVPSAPVLPSTRSPPLVNTPPPPRDVNVEVLTSSVNRTPDLSTLQSSTLYSGENERNSSPVVRQPLTSRTEAADSLNSGRQFAPVPTHITTPPPSIVGSNGLVAPEDIVYDPHPPLGPMAAMFVSRGDREETAVNRTTDVSFVERRDGRGFRMERNEGSRADITTQYRDVEALHTPDQFYDSAYIAKWVHSGIQPIFHFLGGLLAGISLLDAVIVFVLAQQALGQAGLLQYYSPLSVPLFSLYQTLYLLFLLSITDKIDPYNWSKMCLKAYYQSLRQILAAAGWLLIFLAMILTFSIVYIYERISLYPTRPDLWLDLVVPAGNGTSSVGSSVVTHSLNGVQYVYRGQDSTTVTLWQSIAALRALLCCAALLVATWIRNHDRLEECLISREEEGRKETQ